MPPNSLVPSSAVPSLTIGGYVFTDLANLIVLSADVTGANNSSLRRNGITAGYTPSSTNKFRVRAIQVIALGGNGAMTLGYTDNDVGMDTATAPTNLVKYNGIGVGSSVTGASQQYAVNFLILNGKYAYAKGSTVIIYGYEEP